jgi:hypothetical protein
LLSRIKNCVRRTKKYSDFEQKLSLFKYNAKLNLHYIVHNIFIFTCTKIGRQKRGKPDNFKLGSPYVGCNLSEVVVLQKKEKA